MFPNEATRTIDWSGRSSLTYHQFLQAKQFENSFRYGLDEQTTRMIANNSEMSARGLGVLSNALDTGLSSISHGIGDLRDEVIKGRHSNEKNTLDIIETLSWGYSCILAELGRVNDSLEELVRIAKSPAQTWAYEQFDIAKDEYRKGLFDESIQSLKRAIDGYGSNTGFKTEFRFHFLLGKLLIGDAENNSSLTINLSDSEKYFLNSARYSEVDYKNDSSQSYLWAGRAAYLQKHYQIAEAHTRKSIQVNSRNSKANYQLGKILCADGRASEALKPLARAYELDPNLAIGSANDADLLNNNSRIINESAIKEATSRLITNISVYLTHLEPRIQKIERYQIGEFRTCDLCNNELLVINSLISEAKKLNNSARLWQVDDILKSLRRFNDDGIRSLWDMYTHRAVNQCESMARAIEVDISRVDNHMHGGLSARINSNGLIVGAIPLIIAVVVIFFIVPGMSHDAWSARNYVSATSLDLVYAVSPVIIIFLLVLWGKIHDSFRDEYNKDVRRTSNNDIQYIKSEARKHREVGSKIANTPRPEFWS